jgi:chromosome segregation ATPase
MPHLQLDSAQGAAKVPSMVRKLISSAMRSTVEDLLSKPMHDLAEGQKALMVGLQEVRVALGAQTARIDAMGARLDHRIDVLGSELNQRIDAQGARLDQRIDIQGNNLNLRIDGLSARMDEMSAHQNRLTAEVADFRSEIRGDIHAVKTEVTGLKTEVASLKRDRDSADDQAHRITRIEDRVFSP